MTSRNTMTRALARWTALVAATIALLSCKAPPAQILLRIDTDIPQGPMGVLSAVRVELFGATTGLQFYERQFNLREAAGLTLPGDVAIGWTGGDRILVSRVTAVRRTPEGLEDLFSVRAIAPFPREDAVTLDVYLANRCLMAANRVCPQGFTCGRYGCEPETRGELVPRRVDGGAMDVTALPPLGDGGVGDASAGDAGDASADGGGCAGGGSMVCAGRCVDTASDPANCGACGRDCGAVPGVVRATCAMGVCQVQQCESGLDDCDRNAANGCETDLTTATDCGRCGVSCTGSLPNCSSATRTCVSACGAGEARCGATCVNTASSVQHCGRCDNECADFPNGARACAMGACGGTCTMGFADCDRSAVNGCEVNTQSDTMNCGACAMACAAGPNQRASCSSGRCMNTCVATFADCDGMPANGCETDTSTSLSHCGACGAACAAGPNQRASCAAGRCALSCAPGFADCDGMAANGCEASLSSPSHCGTCGRVCSGATPNCDAMTGMCASGCAMGLSNCSGACVDTSTSSAHCGMCGAVCDVRANASNACAGGSCAMTCNAGFGDCDRMPATGCETDTRTDILHCGGCVRPCFPRLGTNGSCVAGACSYACQLGLGDCDGNVTNGCESNLFMSTAHCGACGNACPARANATSFCGAGSCQFTCNMGFTDANLDPLDGCETPTCMSGGMICMMFNCRVYRTMCTMMGTNCVPAEPVMDGTFCSVMGGGMGTCMAGSCVPAGSDAGAEGGADGDSPPIDGGSLVRDGGSMTIDGGG
jgi:hypothetical protein